MINTIMNYSMTTPAWYKAERYEYCDSTSTVEKGKSLIHTILNMFIMLII